MKRKIRITCALLALALAFSMAGCGGSSSASSAASTGSAAGNSGDKVKITFMSRDAGDTPIAKVYQSQIDAFMKENPNITVQNDSIYEEDAYNNKLKVAISTGETPSIFYTPGIASLSEYAKNGVIMDLTAAFDSDSQWKNSFLDGALDTYKLDAYGVKGIYGIPNELNVDAVFYNKELFKKAGISKTPETMDDFYQCIDKLNAAGITPIGVGGKNTWVMGHIFNNILVKRIGSAGVTDLGTGKKKWTDTDVVKCLQITKDLKAKKAFANGFEGMDYNTQMNQFLTGEVAMISHSSPIISEIMNTDSKIKDQFGIFAFPYFTDKPEYKDEHVVYTSGWFLSGTMSAAQKEATLKLIKYMTTNKSIQQRMDAAMRVSPYKNITPSDSTPQLFKDMISYTNTIQKSCGEYFDYDPTPTLCDTSRNAILNMMLSGSAGDTAKTIQSDIDANKTK